jgi:wobble nucleotide-excising tRNase
MFEKELKEMMEQIASATQIPSKYLFGSGVGDEVTDNIKYLLEKFEGTNPTIEDIENELKKKNKEVKSFFNHASKIFGVSRKLGESDKQLRKRIMDSIQLHKGNHNFLNSVASITQDYRIERNGEYSYNIYVHEWYMEDVRELMQNIAPVGVYITVYDLSPFIKRNGNGIV